MKHTFKTEKGDLFFVKVPDNSWNFHLNDFYLSYTDPSQFKSFVNVNGDFKGFELILLTSEVTEEQAKMMVDEQQYYDPTMPLEPIPFYKNYGEGHFLQTALDSFKSLMQHLQVYTVNPYGKQPHLRDEDAGTVEETERRYFRRSAQQRTGKWIVLFKPN